MTSNASWWEAELVVPENLAEDVGAMLIEYGADGVETIAADQVVPPAADHQPLIERPLPPAGQALLVASYAQGDDASAIAQMAQQAAQEFGLSPKITTYLRQDDRWQERWKLFFKPMDIGDTLSVVPLWEEKNVRAPNRHKIIIDPGMAFGTGQHETTRLCLGYLESHFRIHGPAQSMLDVGCGSGILSFAAAYLGVSRILGVDNDPLAVRASEENLGYNRLPKEALSFSDTAVEKVAGTFPLVVANILGHILIAIAAGVSARVDAGGDLLLSGLLESQKDDVIAAYHAQRPWDLVDTQSLGPWLLVHLRATGVPG